MDWEQDEWLFLRWEEDGVGSCALNNGLAELCGGKCAWQDAGPEANPGAVPLDARGFVLANGADVILTVATADLTAGDIDFVCRWWPISDNGSVVAA